MGTRRKFLFDCSAISAMAMIAPIGVCAEANFPSQKRSPDELSIAAFAAQRNTHFKICGPGVVVTVKLDEVRVPQEPPRVPGKRPPLDAGNEKFSLIFSGARRDLLPQETYVFEHETLGRMSFFIVPVFTRNPKKIDYEAVFNRPRANVSISGPQSRLRNQT